MSFVQYDGVHWNVGLIKKIETFNASGKYLRLTFLDGESVQWCYKTKIERDNVLRKFIKN